MARHFIFKSNSAAQGAKQTLRSLGIAAEIMKTPESHRTGGCSHTVKTNDGRVTRSFLISLGFKPDGEY